MTAREKVGYIVMLLVMLGFFIVAVKFSSTCLAHINELLENGELVEAEVIRVQETGNQKYEPVFRFRLSDGSVEEHGSALFYGDLFSRGETMDYIFYPENPEYSGPKTFIRLYGVLILAVFACLFCLSFIVFIGLKLLGISHVNNRFYGVITLITSIVITMILGTLTKFEITRTINLIQGGTKATAKVIRVDKVARQGKKAAKFPVFTFTDSEGVNREIRQNWSGVGDTEVGDAVEIIYNLEYATIARRNGFWYIYGLSLFFTFLLIVFIFIAANTFKKMRQK